ncbi:troponin I, slow skeletal muscle-like [Esox lucius]|uniref:Troponin I4a n=1 Tax=Esox lucius TaxID=8010 RepID=A0A3P8ZRY6_ESOLU|nr:troponin I, slow skeletal muscle-like [Esox lucius]
MSEGPKKSKYSATRRLLLKTKLLKKAGIMLVEELAEKKRERDSILNERVPPLQITGLSAQELQNLCKDLHKKIDIVDEARYDLQIKVEKNDLEIKTLGQKIREMKGTKKPTLKRVKKSATDSMLGAAVDISKVKADFTSGLKKVKKEEEKEEVTDWRKNVDAMSGMEGRKKLFDGRK